MLATCALHPGCCCARVDFRLTRVMPQDIDIYNAGAKHLAKSAGTSPQERAAFGEMLHQCGLVDAFRARHPTAEHCYTYWSQRAGNRRAGRILLCFAAHAMHVVHPPLMPLPHPSRPFNRGLRLDYFVVSERLAAADAAPPKLLDAFMCDGATAGVSDHAPVGVLLAL